MWKSRKVSQLTVNISLLTGGNIIGNINDAWISLEGGGLNIDQIKITNKGSYGGLPIYVDGGRLIINNSLIDGGEGGGISAGFQPGSIEINQGTIRGSYSKFKFLYNL